ncbi:homoserine O-acetyltransferase/O-succinyltransferase family protein [Fructilactobacillus carniphilus]|uniref:Homoserine O-acetyltransferase n=1 Tax=Fructilactobacillus carniphilus TaxID=2940297 RepID=A0ABY5BW62_9LACO|nr:homoserine O-succinyltransferase [Fructilactobacillus carniphilus]USS90302.1 homoserine O-succinyltransferase [Fructilactobacillus carniphilus]
MGRMNILTGYNQNTTTPQPGALNVLIVNLMPKRAETEHQLISVFKRTHQNFNLTFAYLPHHHFQHYAAGVKQRYASLTDVQDQQFDALLVTGAPVDQKAFQEIDYWDDFQSLLAWRRHHVQTSLFLCWAAWAAGEREHQFTGKRLDHKLCGVFTTDGVTMPHSRYFTIPLASVEPGVRVLAGNDQLGAVVLHAPALNSYYVMGHLEYSTNTLALEEQRDQQAEKSTPHPQNYYHNGRPVNRWQADATRFFKQWLASIPAQASKKVLDK